MSKYNPEYTTRFRRNRRLLIKRGYDMLKLEVTIDLLLKGDPMPPEYRDHTLKGNYVGYRECHVGGEGDWLLVYKIHEDKLILVLTETGTHADLFE
ncbi:MAG: type II toxin-antitoxin system YafQ family toxin [Oscillospiraceae bacterium]|nr:type II toxin-antitoxin system YafQ family toxin [Oscillospiraceae bacterium]